MRELEVMKQIAQALEGLNREEVKRVLKWTMDKFNVSLEPKSIDSDHREPHQYDEEKDGHEGYNTGGVDKISFKTVGELYYQADPGTDANKALVTGYWLQIIKGNQEIDSYSVNDELKHLGHRIGNITRAFNQLMAEKPQLVIQTRKNGNTQQARKRYKLTIAGIKTVEEMIDSESKNV